MKFRLPQSFFVALVSAIAAGGACVHAEAITGTVIHDTPQMFTDGSTVSIGDGKTETDYSIQYKWTSETGEALSVTGGSTLNVNNATVSKIPVESQMIIGDSFITPNNGTGTLNLNQAKVDLTDAVTFIVGVGETAKGTVNVDNHSTFIGASNSLWLCNGAINVTNHSSFNTSTSSDALQGMYGGYRTILGYYNGVYGVPSQIEVNVSGTSSFVSGASRFVAGWNSNSEIKITVDGEDSTFTQLDYVPADKSIETITYLCDGGTNSNGSHDRYSNNVTTEISATNGGRVDFQSKMTYIGAEGDFSAGRTNKSATFNVDNKSSIAFKNMEIYASTKINNNGSFKADGTMNLYEGGKLAIAASQESSALTSVGEMLILGGELENHGKLECELLGMTSGKLTNSGTIKGEIFMDGGTFTMENGAVAGGLTATSGTIYLNGDVTFTSAVVLGFPISAATLMTLSGESDALTLYINQGSTINADELTVGNGTSIAVILNEGETYEEGMELFTVTGSDTATVNAIESALGKNVTVYNNGDIESEGIVLENAVGSITTAVVPEPATATLSLLALASLAMRRRRK